MLYSDFQDKKISQLAFGCMRFPTIGGGGEDPIDEKETERMIAYAYEKGVNYYDTAYVYHGGDSERVTGNILRKFPREKWHIATKFPGFNPPNVKTPLKTFEEQLGKTGVDYFDFYLLHNVAEGHAGAYMDDNGVVDTFVKERNTGRIRHLGFSAHGRYETVKTFLEKHGEKMEFCQLQINYLDWTLQKAGDLYKLLTEYNIPIFVMEPVRGGRLAKLAESDAAKLKAARPNESIAAWAFRWIQTLPNVKTTLSGMSTFEQVEDNVKTYSEEKPLNSQEKEILNQIAAGMLNLLPCTGCRYCCPECPVGLDIPSLLLHYNDCRFEPNMNDKWAVNAMPEGKRPSACTDCGACKRVCPQNIDIPSELKNFKEVLAKLPD